MAGENNSSAEKSEEPTQKKLQKASDDGDTVRSKELNTAAILISGSAGLLLFGAGVATSMKDIMSHNFVLPRSVLIDEQYMLNRLSDSIFAALQSLFPLFLLLLAAAIVGPILLGGWNMTFKAIAPKASRMNPLSGLQRIFGPKALVELAKAAAKVLVVACVVILVLYTNIEGILALQSQNALPAVFGSISHIGWSVLIMSCALLIITAIDIPVQIQQHTQKLRMTLQEVKDEMKDTDGRPEVKQKIRQLQQQMASNRMMEDVPEADVIITNPDHYAVALRYDHGQESAPRLLAKGLDRVAFRIKDVATEHDIPVVSSPELARAVYFNTDIGQEIPSGLYVAVAQVLAYIHQLRLFAKGKARKPRLSKKLDIPEDLRHD